MKRFLKEIIIMLLQLFMFYILPLLARKIDIIVFILLLIIGTFILSIVMSSLSKEKIKYFYPLLVAIFFIPSVFIYYNESALIHAVWYFVVSLFGLGIGIVINKVLVINKIRN